MTTQWLAGLALTGLVGASLGVLGAGGSIVMVPVLVYIVGVEPHAAVPLSLLIVGATSLRVSPLMREVGRSGGAARCSSVVRRSSAPTSAVGSPAESQVRCCSWYSASCWFWSDFACGRQTKRTARLSTTRPQPWLMSAGCCVGVVTGFLGVGGGFLIVPVLVKVGGLDMRHAIRTSLVVIALSSLAGLAAHVAHGNAPSLRVAVPLIVAAVVGMAAGTQVGVVASGETLRRGFAGFVTVVGAALIVANTPAAFCMLG